MSQTRLFHISDVSGIETFEPRLDNEGKKRVWAITEQRLHNYLLPRDCPRVTFFADAQTSVEDKERFLAGSKAVVAIESGWFAKCLEAVLHLYEFDPASFTCTDETAGYYTATCSVQPLGETRVPTPLQKILERGVELRVLPSLWQLRDAVAESSLGFSIIRMRNARPRP